MRALVWISLAIGAFVLGLYAGPTLRGSDQSADAALTCRPSSPDRLGGPPPVLFWGNSIAFDHGWPLDNALSVNCAVQGMTAEAALERTPALPQMDFAAIVLVFGTVELLRGDTDANAFQAEMTKMVGMLEQKYPQTQLIVLGVASHGADRSVWRYTQDAPPVAFNRILRTIPGVAFIDTARILSRLPGRAATYDGVHLTRQSYQLLRVAVQETLSNIR